MELAKVAGTTGRARKAIDEMHLAPRENPLAGSPVGEREMLLADMCGRCATFASAAHDISPPPYVLTYHTKGTEKRVVAIEYSHDL